MNKINNHVDYLLMHEEIW